MKIYHVNSVPLPGLTIVIPLFVATGNQLLCVFAELIHGPLFSISSSELMSTYFVLFRMKFLCVVSIKDNFAL